MRISSGCNVRDSVKIQDSRLKTGVWKFVLLVPRLVSCVLCLLLPSVSVVALFGIVGCGEESPTDKGAVEPIKTGISGTNYLNVEHGFRLSNLPASGWVIRMWEHKDGNTESVLLMAFTTEDMFTFDTDKLIDDQTPFAKVSVYGPNPSLPNKPDAAKEVMDTWIAGWEWMGIEVISRKPVAGVNTTGYEAMLSMSMADAAWTVKWAFFAKHDRGYIIAFWAPEDKYTGLITFIDPIIADFEILGR